MGRKGKGKGEPFSMKPCSHASMEAEEGAPMRRAGKEKSSLKPCNKNGGSKSKGEVFSLKPCSTGGMAAAESFTASMSLEAVGEDCSLKVCSTKRKKQTARQLLDQEQWEDDSSDEDTVADVSTVGQGSLAIKVALVAEKGELGKLSDDSEDEDGEEGKVISNSEKDGSVDDDDDDKSITASEFAAFLEEERAEYRRFWEEEVLPRNTGWVLKDYTKEGDDCDFTAKVLAGLESN